MTVEPIGLAAERIGQARRWPLPAELARFPMISDAVRSAGAVAPRIVYGLRMAASLTLAMWISFWLQLENAYWAPLTAAIVCQPTIGASLRKGQFRIVGTFVGAMSIVLMTAVAPEARIALVAELIVWTSLAAFCSTLLKNAAAYAAALSGYSAVIVFADAVGGSPQDTFLLAVTRATEISIGVVSAGFVLAISGTGNARRHLARGIGRMAGKIAEGLRRSIEERDHDGLRGEGHELIAALAALDPSIDEVIGESADIRYRSRALHAGVEGLLRAVCAWRGLTGHVVPPGTVSDGLDRLAIARMHEGLHAVVRADWRGDPARARTCCLAQAGGLRAQEAATVATRLVLDLAAEALHGLAAAANAVALLSVPEYAERERQRSRLHVPDVLPALVNALRVSLVLAAAFAIWIELGWSGGQGTILFASIVTILFGAQDERAGSIVSQFGLGTAFAAIVGAFVEFFVLPHRQGFLALALVISAVVVPAAAMAAGRRWRYFFVPLTWVFIAFLAPTNRQVYDLADYLNRALAIVAGCSIGLIGFRLVPPLPRPLRRRRLLALTLRDARRLAAGRLRRSGRDWIGLSLARTAALPPGCPPADRASLVGGFMFGESVIRLLGNADPRHRPHLVEILDRFAAGGVAEAIAQIVRLERRQAADVMGLRTRAELVQLRTVLARHRTYFEGRLGVSDPARSVGPTV